ncbi:MAG TPA: CehA/McbA family metallohydrolase [Kofleriaceae bacterium]|nr:CehA/McbA family metallohydrolase [Kofleriaceae bacterium]
MKLAALAVILACTPALAAPRWLAGDVHMHCAPPDDPADVELDAAQIAAAARAAHMDFVVLTPHAWPSQWGRGYRKRWRSFAADARAEPGVTLIPGIEWSTSGGHFTVAGVAIDALPDRDLLAAAHAAGAFISVNHPFAVPTNIPGVGASHFDMSYRVWTDGARGFTAIDGVEVFNLPLALANLIRRPGGMTGEQRAWLAADRIVHAEHRKVTAVGGTDNHHRVVTATTWVLADDTSERAILDALRAGRTCIGGPEAGSFRARGDDGAWVGIGGTVRAAHDLALAWDGTARLYVDGKDAGEHAGGATVPAGGALHTYRIERGDSRCGFIYANL